jgi:ketosteroid isomerase-like protein
MGREPIEVVRLIHEAWAEGARAHGLIAEDLTYVNPANAVESGTRQGSDTFNRVNDVYERFRPQVERMVDLGERVLVIVSGSARMRNSDVNVPIRQGYLWTVRDGKAVRFEWFTSPEEALAAVGMAGKAQEPGDNALSG